MSLTIGIDVGGTKVLGGCAVDDVEAAGGVGGAVVERRVHDAGSQAEQ